MSHTYLEALVTRLDFLYIVYATSSHEQNGSIITFIQFKEEIYRKTKKLVEDKSISASIDDSYSYNNSINESSVDDNSGY